MDSPLDDSGEAPASVPDMTAAIARGDEAAFSRFHGLYWKRTYAYAMGLTKGNKALAGDIAQTTMVRAASRLRKMDSEEALWAWLRRVARNAFIDTCRADRRRPRLIEWKEENLDAAGGKHGRPDEAPLLAALDAALQNLTTDERSLIEETYYQGRKQAVLAGELGLSLKALESRLTRLREKLRQTVLFLLRHE